MEEGVKKKPRALLIWAFVLLMLILLVGFYLFINIESFISIKYIERPSGDWGPYVYENGTNCSSDGCNKRCCNEGMPCTTTIMACAKGYKLISWQGLVIGSVLLVLIIALIKVLMKLKPFLKSHKGFFVFSLIGVIIYFLFLIFYVYDFISNIMGLICLAIFMYGSYRYCCG